jgi:hypothetical protein
MIAHKTKNQAKGARKGQLSSNDEGGAPVSFFGEAEEVAG